ncbi:4360_t:CDS:2, partial [Gigaspora margarita]
MSNDINPKETVNVLLIYLLQLQYLAIQSFENNHHDLLVKNNDNEEFSKIPETSEKSSESRHFSLNEISSRPNQGQKTTHDLLSEQVPPLHGETNPENNNELVNQNLDEYNLQLIGNNLNLSNGISENSQGITKQKDYVNESDYEIDVDYEPYIFCHIYSYYINGRYSQKYNKKILE